MTPTLSSAERSAETLSVWQEQWNLISDYWSDPLKGLSSFYEEVSDVPAVMATYQDFAAQHGWGGQIVEAAALSGVALANVGFSIPLVFRDLGDTVIRAYQWNGGLKGCGEVAYATADRFLVGLEESPSPT